MAEDALFELYNGSGYWVTYVTPKSISMQQGESKIQLITYDYFDTPFKVFDHFDFSVNMGAFDIKKGEFILGFDFLTSLADRSIKFNRGTKYPLASLCRINKYIEKGFMFSRTSLIRIGTACAELNIDTWDRFEEQIGGIYGQELLRDDLPTFNLASALVNIDSLFVKMDIGDYTGRRIKEITGLDIEEDHIYSIQSLLKLPQIKIPF